MSSRVEKALPTDFRKLKLEARRAALDSAYGNGELELGAVLGGEASLADYMVESAVGYLPVPLGIATGFLIDGRSYDIPMAIEEPSVIAAAAFAARLIKTDGGFSTWATEPISTFFSIRCAAAAEAIADSRLAGTRKPA